MIFKFKKHDQLIAHKIPNGERIGESVHIRDIAHLGTVVIKCTRTRANHKEVATHEKHGLAMIPEKQGRNGMDIRHRSDLSESRATRRDNTKTA